MVETVVNYQISADIEAVKKAMADADTAAARLGDSIAKSLSDGGAKGARGLSQNLNNEIQGIERRGSSTMAAVGTALGRGFAVAVVAAAGAGIKALFDDMKELGELANRTGLSAERLSAIKSAGSAEGVSGADIVKGIDALGAAANKEFREGEGDITKLFELNNLKLSDREGKLKDINELLGDASTLIQNAKTEYDKIEIAKTLGLTKDWVKALENGPAAFAASVTEAERLGGALDEKLVAKAAAFDEAWNKGWANFALNAKAAISSALSFLNGLTNSMGGMMEPGKSAPVNEFGIPTGEAPPSSQEAPLEFTVTTGKGGKKNTKIPTSKRASAGSSAKTDEEKAEDRLLKYTDALKRQGDVLEAEIATFGKSNAERKAAIELAKAKVDLDKVDEETRARLTIGIREAVSANEAYREVLDRQKGAMDAAKSAAGELSNAFADIVLDGARAEDALKSVLKSFIRQAINGAFAGQGSFAGLFGTKESGGAFGGILSSLLGGFSGRAGGGELPRGFTMVGENGPELLRNSGSGVARVYPHGQSASGSSNGSTVVMNNDFRGADAGAVAQIKQHLSQIEKTFNSRVIGVNRAYQSRGYA